MSTLPRAAFLVAHTHWDREWYLPFARFRVNLVEVVDQVLDALDHDPDLQHFLLDGQCAVLEDYLAARPASRDRVQRLVREGKLAVGPWYVLADEFLVSGEATVRNLMHGRRAAPLGRRHAVGYLPDTFGHIAQMPQILRLAGLDSFVFTRGMDDRTDEVGWLFRWRSPDGSEVLAVNQCDGYCNAAGLGLAEIWHGHTQRTVEPERAVAQVRSLLTRMGERPGSDPALLNNGCDHYPPQRRLGAVLAALGEALPTTTFTAGTLRDFLTAARAERPDDDRPLLDGELLGGRDHLILSGVWSTRMELKRRNEAAQNLLARVVEPLCAADWARNGSMYPGGLLDTAWRELLRNHAHDSICGCSTDEVHREMMTRFATVDQTGRQLLGRLMHRWAPTFARHADNDGDTVLCVANPLPQVRDAVIDRVLVLPVPHPRLEDLRLVDQAGVPVPCEIIKPRYIERFWGIDHRLELHGEEQHATLDTYLTRFGHRIVGTADDHGTHDCLLHVRFLARDLPAVGHVNYRLLGSGGKTAALPPPVSARRDGESAVLENAHLRAVLHPDGTIDLTDKPSGRTYPGLNLLEDAEDRGDEYDYCPLEVSEVHFSGGCAGKVRLDQCSELRGAAETTFRFDLPRSLNPDRRGRHPRTTPCDVTVGIRLDSGARRLEITTTFNNRAFDHRVRAWFPTGLVTDEVVSDGHFLLNRRPVTRPSRPDWTQPAPPTWPQQDFSYLTDDKDGLAVFNRGLPEFETITSSDGSVIYALTLLRSVDWLSRDDLPVRRNQNAGPTLHTPEAQGIGRHVCRYAVMPCGPDVFAADVKGESELYRTPPPALQGVADGARPGQGSFLAGTDPRVTITALKRSDRGEVLIVRLCNLDDNPVTETLQCGVSVLDVEKVSLLEAELQVYRDDPVVTHGGRQIRVPLGPHEIATLALFLDRDAAPAAEGAHP